RTPATAGPAATPTPVRPATRAASTAPRAPGVGLTDATADPPRYTITGFSRPAWAPKAARAAARARALPIVTAAEPPKSLVACTGLRSPTFRSRAARRRG